MTNHPPIAGVRLLDPLPSGEPLVTVPALQADRPVRAVLVTAALDPVQERRVRKESANLEALLARVDPDAVLQVLDHGLDTQGRRFLIVDMPGSEAAAPLSPDDVAAAARAMATGLDALAAHGFVGSPPGLCTTPSGAFVLMAPLPPVLDELVAATGPGTGHEPPEVLCGSDWTRASQVYTCASMLWTLLTGRSPHADHGTEDRQRLARLNGSEPVAPGDAPDLLIDVLRTALLKDPAERPAEPAALAAALEAAWSPRSRPTMPPRPSPPGTAGAFRREYELLRKLGSGGTAHVWAARRRSDGMDVAVKLLDQNHSRDPEVVERFTREYTLLMEVRHPHLIRVHQLVLDPEETGLVMDLLGDNLHTVASRGRPATTDAAGWLAQVAAALAALHQAGIMHRDVKPHNVLIGERDGRSVAVLADFGAARRTEGATDTRLIGTVAYLAPELAAGRTPTTAVDVYGLGVIAYELFAGRPPYRKEDTTAMMLAHMNGGAPRPDGISDDAWAVISACMTKDREARPTAAEAALRWEALAGRPVLDGVDVPRPPGGGRSSAQALAPEDPGWVPAVLGKDDEPGSGTIISARPVPARPKESAPPRARRKMTLAAVSIVALGVIGGVGAAMLTADSDHPSQKSAAAKPSTPPPQLTVQPVPASIATTGPGSIQIGWTADRASLPGLSGYAVWDVTANRPISATLPAASSSFRISGLPAGERACFLVVAYVTAAPQGPLAQSTCVTPTN
ncbi:serine/threonine-protein kinase [Actinomadura decatromicini]|uniref:non-specific serine/threonine protein kinase n=1 Tax=Actinomadura decatromicini TaxID=2604572 RepID=A0A5D3F5Q2_9ACTN|nr:serine/threonine-protein kinase [Actinomadura decatromicini]TYK43641.1 protein kinase [Actinomadura decatromicini]